MSNLDTFLNYVDNINICIDNINNIMINTVLGDRTKYPEVEELFVKSYKNLKEASLIYSILPEKQRGLSTEVLSACSEVLREFCFQFVVWRLKANDDFDLGEIIFEPEDEDTEIIIEPTEIDNLITKLEDIVYAKRLATKSIFTNDDTIIRYGRDKIINILRMIVDFTELMSKADINREDELFVCNFLMALTDSLEHISKVSKRKLKKDE